jgi:hypothetical protein
MPTTKPLPSSFITSDTVNRRVALYLGGVHAQTTQGLQAMHGNESGQTRWIWYSKDQVQEWCNEINDLGASGIRIYLGQKETLAENEVPEEHEPLPGQLCIMLVLTKQNANDPERHDNIIYEKLSDFAARKQKTELAISMNLNAGSYSPPLRRPGITDDYPID